MDVSTIALLKKGGVGVMPTDTIYGIVGSALSKKAVARIYRLRKRNLKKPMIILIGSISDLKKFGVNLSPNTYNLLPTLWPDKVSVVLPCVSKKFEYLHRGMKSIAFRMPKTPALRAFLKKTGPLVAPSANIEGEEPSKKIMDAFDYFGDKVDFYIDGGKRISKPSTLVKIEDGKVMVLRQGAVKL